MPNIQSKISFRVTVHIQDTTYTPSASCNSTGVNTRPTAASKHGLTDCKGLRTSLQAISQGIRRQLHLGIEGEGTDGQDHQWLIQRTDPRKCTRSLNPPPEKKSETATSGIDVTAPTVVTLRVNKSRSRQWARFEQSKRTYYGQLAGYDGRKRVALRPSLVLHRVVAGSALPSPTPRSPEAKSNDMPRTPE